MENEHALIYLSDARKEIAKAKTIDEAKGIRDKAEAARIYAKKAGATLEIQNDVAEIKLLAERRCGELLAEMDLKSKCQGSKSHDAICLKDLNITLTQSSRWQLEALVPVEDFQAYLDESRVKRKEITSCALVTMAQEIKKAKKRSELKKKGNAEAREGLIEDLEAVVGTYRCVYMDPPWKYRDEGCRGAAESHYETSPVDAIKSMGSKDGKSMPIPNLAHKDGCHFWIWTTWPMIRDKAIHILVEEWGLSWVGEIVWDKVKMGTGRWLRSRSEVLVLAVTKKSMPLLGSDQPNFETLEIIEEDRSEKHSEKPERFRRIVEKLSPGPRIELFARKANEGWDRWGKEA